MLSDFTKGVIYAVSACFIWGMIYVVPLFMPGFTSMEIAIGRFFVFGILSLLILFRYLLKKVERLSFSQWKTATIFSLVCSFGFYIFFVLSLRYSNPDISALIMGLSPITIAFYGNWRKKECSYKTLIFPSILILAGLMVINIPRVLASINPGTYLIGITCAFVSFISWSWFVVYNSQFLKDNPQISTNRWTTVLGVTTLFWVIVFSLITGLFFNDQFSLQKLFQPGDMMISYFFGSLVLGVICSWLGYILWNQASFYISTSLAGQLTIFETIFGIVFYYIYVGQLPPYFELLGVALMLVAIAIGIKVASTATIKTDLVK